MAEVVPLDKLPEKEKEVVEKVKSVASGNVDILGPVDPPGATPKISAAKVDNLLSAYFASQNKAKANKAKDKSSGPKNEEEVKEKIPIKMKLDKITPNGKMGINFN